MDHGPAHMLRAQGRTNGQHRLPAKAALLAFFAFGLIVAAHMLGRDAQAATQPELIFPFSPGQQWSITCGYADGSGCQHPDNAWNRYALDFQRVGGPSAAEGQPVIASASGVVETAGWGGGDSFGWYVVIAHGKDYTTLYAHMQEDFEVAEGDIVEQGDTIGYTGCSGYCTGPHIHFLLMHNGETVPPEPMCGESGFDDGQTHTGCAPQSSVPPGSIGDPNCDGYVNSVDASLILQFEAGITDVKGCPAAGDVNGDAVVSALDAAIILQYNAGIIDELLAQP